MKITEHSFHRHRSMTLEPTAPEPSSARRAVVDPFKEAVDEEFLADDIAHVDRLSEAVAEALDPDSDF